MLREVEDAILNLLKSDSDLSVRVAAWYRGFPRGFEKYPYIIVNWVGGILEYRSGVCVYRNHYEVIAVDLRANPEDAEASVMEITERIYNILKSNPNLNGLVADSKPIRWDAEGIPTERGSLKGGRIIIETTSFI